MLRVVVASGSPAFGILMGMEGSDADGTARIWTVGAGSAEVADIMYGVGEGFVR